MERIVFRLEQACMVAAVFCMITVMFVVAYDAIARYALNAPLPWAFEVLNYYVLVALAYFAVSPTFQRGDHIGVDLFYNLMGPRARAACDLVTAVLSAMFFAWIGYATFAAMMKSFDRGAVYLGYFAYPAWLSYFPVVLGSALLVVRLLTHMVALLRHGEDPNVGIHEGDGS
ncbi:TRAP transporter small permease [Antarctobacter sp.]|uniref:TRAP transporter small permease n=1 Tax=Antarctobacter sp. TaxID=1872577 RepID=UPI003A8E8393